MFIKVFHKTIACVVGKSWKDRFRVAAFLCIFLSAADVIMAQDSEDRWALRYSANVWDKPLMTERPAGYSADGHGSHFELSGEYYLPDKWNIQAGYFHTELSYGHSKRTMEGLRAGVKRYFLDRNTWFQPYLAGLSELNWSRHKESASFSGGYMINGQYVEGYSGDIQAINPVLSIVPTAGIEIFIFSSVAFVCEYDFNIGLGSSTKINLTEGGKSMIMRDKGMFQSLSLGVKLTFPFRVTGKDGETLFELISGAIIGVLERKSNEMKLQY